jgi:hypothetical protein
METGGLIINSSLLRVALGAAFIGVTTLSQGAAPSQATTAQLMSSNDCDFVMHVPGVFGGTNLHLKMRKGAVFTEDTNRHKFCGVVTQAGPIGESKGDQCFVITDGKLVSGAWSDKVTSSNCVLTDASAMHVPFVVSELAPWAGSGPASLHGQAFLKTAGGDVRTCAGERVLLLPANPYVDELLDKSNAGISAPPDQQLMPYIRSTICDAQGNFSFAQLPAQRWYVLTQVTWQVPHLDATLGYRPGPLTSHLFGTSAAPDMDRQGGELQQGVTLSPSDNQTILTYRDQR